LGAVAILAVCGAGAWLLTKPAPPPRGVRPYLPPQVFDDHEARPATSTQSFEDALLHLELSRARTEAKLPKDVGRRSAPSATVKRAAPSERKGPKADRPSAKDEDEKELAKNIIADFVGKLLPSEAGDPRDIVDSALKTLEAEKKQKPKNGKKKKKQKASDEDVQKAKGIIDDMLRKLGPQEADGNLEDADAAPRPEEDFFGSHAAFERLLGKERQKTEHFSLADVKKEFSSEFSRDGRGLMCSGCKLVAARLESEFDTHDVSKQDTPVTLLAAKRKALDSACASFRYFEVVSDDSGPPRYEAVAGPAAPSDTRKAGIAQRLCTALLEEYRFDMLAHMIQGKMEGPAGGGRDHSWERWLCASRSRLCKMSEVGEVNDDEL